MKIELSKTVEIPQGIEVNLENSMVTVKGPKGELKKELDYPSITLNKKDNTIIIESKEATKKEKAVIGTFEAHLKNMFTGVTVGFKYKMKVLYSHFPMTLKQVDKDIEIHNFFGEKHPRKSKIVGNVNVKLEKDEVIVEGIDKEEVGQTSANLWQGTKVKRKDTRVFQDGIYPIEKGLASEPAESKPKPEAEQKESEKAEGKAEEPKPEEKPEEKPAEKIEEKPEEKAEEKKEEPKPESKEEKK